MITIGFGKDFMSIQNVTPDGTLAPFRSPSASKTNVIFLSPSEVRELLAELEGKREITNGLAIIGEVPQEHVTWSAPASKIEGQ